MQLSNFPIALSLCLLTSACIPNHDSAPTPRQEQVARPVSSATLQFENGIPTVACHFGDQRSSGRCSLDTGASQSILPSELVSWSSKFDVLENRDLKTINSAATCKRLRFSSFNAESLIFDPTNVLACEGLSTSGLIGIGSLDHRSWEFDFKNLALSEKPFENSTSAFDLKRDAGRNIFVPVQFRGRSTFAAFDTGISLDGAVEKEFVTHNLDLFRLTGHTPIRDPFGHISQTEIYELSEMRIGAKNLGPLKLVVLDSPALWSVYRVSGASILLGSGSLRRLKWSLDLDSNRATVSD